MICSDAYLSHLQYKLPGHISVLPHPLLAVVTIAQGEEISIGIRGFTYGYDFYAPRDSVVFHEYAERNPRRKKVPMFWENSDKHRGEGQRSLARSMSIIKMSPDIQADAWDHTDEDRYGLGTGECAVVGTLIMS